MRLCAGTNSSTSTSANLKYVLTDVQGSTRAVMDNSGSGSSTIVARHDYLPFGEEIWTGMGLRTTAQKYSVTESVRQSYALTERDDGTGLDHTLFRKYESFAGRWTSPDPAPGTVSDPQSLNRYSYVKNDPTNRMDPSGLLPCNPGDRDLWCGWDSISRGFWGQGNLVDRPRNTGRTIIQDREVSEWRRIELRTPGGFIWFPLITQDPINPDPERHMKDDCQTLADVADEEAAKSNTDTGFVRGLQHRLQAAAGTREYASFRSSGFQQQFRDEGPGQSFNQVRHFVGTFAGGYYGALFARAETFVFDDFTAKTPEAYADLAVAIANAGETSNADRALNQHSARTGALLALGAMNRNEIGPYIRKNVCEPRRR